MGSSDHQSIGPWISYKKCRELLTFDQHDEDVIEEIKLSLVAEARSGLPMAGGFSVTKFSRESLYAMQVAAQSFNEISKTEKGRRNTCLNSKAYSLGRIMARNWSPPGNFIRALWRGAVGCNLVRDDGPFQVISTIVSGLKAGLGFWTFKS